MKRAVVCVPDPWNYYDQLQDWSTMTVNPDNSASRQQYLLEKSDWSMLITQNGIEYRDGGDYPGERICVYTSGTTGDSKFYSFNQEQVNHGIDVIAKSYDLTANDRYVSVMPLWHAHGQTMYWVARHVGCETHFLSIKDIRKTTEFQPTFITAIPEVLQVMHNLPLKSLRFVRSGSAPLKNDLYLALKNRFQVPVIEYFGMSEILGHIFTNPLKGEQRIGTIGLPTDAIEACIENNHLWLKSTRAYSPDWFDTGDLAEQDDRGYYRILCRSVDQLNIKGKKFNPVSLESQIIEHFVGLKECVVFGDHELNCVYVGDYEPKEIQQFLLGLDPYLRPRLLTRVDTIPVTASGKISRSFLRQQFNCK